MKNSYPDAGDSSDEDMEALERENLLSRFSAPTNEVMLPAPVDGPRYNIILNPLSAVLICVLPSLRTHKHRRPVSHRAAQSKYNLLLLYIYSTLPRPLRLRPRALMFVSFIILIWTPIILLATVLAYGGIPPDYSAVKRWERELPQHVWRRSEVINAAGMLDRRSDTDVRGEDGRRYLRFSDHLWGHGLNNVLQETLLTSHLAHLAQRSFVFEDFTWSHLPVPYTLYDFALRPTRVPLGAFVRGWVVGGGTGNSQWRSVVEEHGSGARAGSTPILRMGDASDGDNDGDGASSLTPSVNSTATTSTTTSTSARAAIEERRAVSAEYFDYVCPLSRRIEIWYGRDVSPAFNLNHSLPSQGNPDNLAAGVISVPPPPDHEAFGNEIMEWWIRRLQQPDVRDQPCVVVREEERRVFDSHFFGSTRILSLFDDLKRSPALRGFTWSPLVQHALEKMTMRFFGDLNSTLASAPGSGTVHLSSSQTSSTRDSSFSSTPMPTSSPISQPIISGLLAVHLRRGDYKRHCLRLAEWRAGYMGFNRFDGMLDTFDVEGHLAGHRNATYTLADHTKDSRRRSPLDEHLKAYYLAHCLPTIQQIVQRLHDVREEYQHLLDTERGQGLPTEYALSEVYALTNGWPAFMCELRAALLADGWGRVMGTPQIEDANAIDCADVLPGRGENYQNILAAGSRRLQNTIDPSSTITAGGLTREEKGVSVALDMAFAERAEVFVGNGFSSLSSNVVMLRMANGVPVHANRLL